MLIEWSRHNGELVEEVIAVFLLRAYPGAQRIKPDQGDGGIDIRIPDGDKWHVVQVKSFTGKLDASKWRQIQKSFDRLRASELAGDLAVSKWTVIRPEDPTRKQIARLKGLGVKTEWEIDFWGLVMCESLAADYPEVVDYYFHDGRDRVEALAKSYLRAVGARKSSKKKSFTAKSSMKDLRAIHQAINRADPHYSYDFEVRTRPAGVRDDDEEHEWASVDRNVDGMVLATALVDDKRAVIVRILAKYPQAVEDRPIRLTITPIISAGDPAEEQWRDFLRYGKSTELIPARTVSTGPGGFSRKQSVGAIRIKPANFGSFGVALTLEVLAATVDEVVAALSFEGPQIGVGPTGRGASISARDSSGTAQLDLTTDFGDGRTRINFTWTYSAGRDVAAAYRAARAMVEYRAPYRFRLRITDGPAVTTTHTFDDREDNEPIPLLGVLESLNTIQQNVGVRLRSPEFSEMSDATVNEWAQVAKILRGESVTTPWDRATSDYGDDAPRIGDIFRLEWINTLSTKVAGDAIDLGLVHVSLSPGVVTSVENIKDARATHRIELAPLSEKGVSQLRRPTSDEVVQYRADLQRVAD